MIYIFQAKREASIGKPWTRKVNYSIIKEPINRKNLCSHSMIIAEGATLGTINQSNVSRHFVIDVCRDIGWMMKLMISIYVKRASWTDILQQNAYWKTRFLFTFKPSCVNQLWNSVKKILEGLVKLSWSTCPKQRIQTETTQLAS